MAGGRRKGKSGAISVGRRRPKIKKWNVVPAAEQARNKRSTGGFFPDEMVNEILLRLPSSSCIVRFRCVCKSWNSLLSEPGSIHNILSAHYINSTEDDENAQVLIKGVADDNEDGDDSCRFVYSLLSYKDLKPVSPIGKDPDLPFVPNKVRSYTFPEEGPVDIPLKLSIVGCCDGIVCIADNLYANASDIILWNPATSETMILPRSPFSGDRVAGDGRLFEEHLGFGFDARTNDYKVIRSIYAPVIILEDDFAPIERKSWYLVEVYSLRNDSWKKMDGHSTPPIPNPVRYPHTYRGEMLYWWASDREDTSLMSWDLGKEEFDWISFPNPTGKYEWVGQSFILLKDSIVGVFSDSRGNRLKDRSFEIRALLKFDKAMPWTLLYSIGELAFAHNFPAIWKYGSYFVDTIYFSRRRYRSAGLLIFDPEAETVRELGIEDKIDVEIVTFVPSQISLSGFKSEDGCF